MEHGVITDIQIPFLRLVTILIKWTLAAIPAAIIAGLIFTVVFGLLATIFGGLFGGMHMPISVTVPPPSP